MGFGDALLAVAVSAAVEGYILHRTVFLESTFHTLCFAAFAVNAFLKFIVYDFFVYPLLLNPLRHLPRIPVRSPGINACLLWTLVLTRHQGLRQRCQNPLREPARQGTARMDENHPQPGIIVHAQFSQPQRVNSHESPGASRHHEHKHVRL